MTKLADAVTWHVAVAEGCLELVKPSGEVFATAPISRDGERKLIAIAMFDNDAEAVKCNYNLKLTQF